MVHQNIKHLLRFTLGVSILSILCYLLLSFGIRHETSEDNLLKPMLHTKGLPNIAAILDKTRSKIRKDLSNYNFTHSSVDKLEDLLTEHGGTPIRSLVISTWRSGSTFFAEILNAMPSNFYHYEPLLRYHIKQIRGGPRGAQATRDIKNMFHCNFTGLENYFEYGKKHMDYLNQFKHNTRLWDQCKDNLELCLDADFTGKFCKLFPFQSMKVVRFRLHLVDNILNDGSFNVKVVLLVRDPRGVLQSRRYRHYCQPALDCIAPAVVCSDMTSDYNAATQLIKKYPGRLMVLRYEDLALNLNETVLKLQRFLKLSPTQSVNEFLNKHTNVQAGGIDSTFRITQDVPFKWKNVLHFDYVNEIQSACEEAMSLWGYQMAYNASHMKSKNFFPLLPYHMEVDNVF